jgi:hypothetical protein
MTGRAFLVQSAAVVVMAIAAAGCGGSEAGSRLVPAADVRGGVRAPRITAKATPAPWTAYPLPQPIGIVGGAAGGANGAYVSDATAGVVERVTNQSTFRYVVNAAHVFGLSAVGAAVLFDDDTGYGALRQNGQSQVFSEPLPPPFGLTPGEITYYAPDDAVFFGGEASSGPACVDVLYVAEGGTSSLEPYIGDFGTAPCGVSTHHLTSDGTFLWFAETNTSPKYLSYFTPQSTSTVDYRLPSVAAAATPGEVTADTADNVYFSLCGVTDTHPGGGAYLVAVNAASPDETVFSTYAPCANTTNSMVYDGADQRLWIASGTNTLTAIRPSDGAVSAYHLPSQAGATSGFVAVTSDGSDTIWAFRNGDAYAHAYRDQDVIAAQPAYASTFNNQPVQVVVTEGNYSGGFAAAVVAGSNPFCRVSTVAGTAVKNTFAVASPPGTHCSVAFSDTAGLATVYVPIVTAAGSGIPPVALPPPS